MSKQANPTVIGGFVIGAILLIVAGVIVFGSGKFFADTVPAVMYFEGDIKGLRVGASVAFEGVPVGTVTDIGVVVDAKDLSARMPVTVEIRRDHLRVVGIRDLPGRGQALKAMIEQKNLRAQLQLESMVTGQLFIQLAFHPEAQPKQFIVDSLTNLPEIPTVPTTLQQVQDTVRKALEKIGQLPLEEIVTNLNNTLAGIDRLVNAPEVLDAVRTFKATLTDTQQLVRNFDQQLKPVGASATAALDNVGKLAQNADGHLASLTTNVNETLATLKETVASARGTFEQASQTLTSVDGVTAPNSPVRYELVKTLQELGEAARALRVLADYLERNPNSVLFGKRDVSAK